MAILLIGGTGRSLAPLAPKLHKAGIPVVITSRRGAAAGSEGIRAVRFDWADEKSWAAAFEAVEITGVVLTAPQVLEPAETMNPFIDLAINKGVKRFVMIGGLSVQKGGPWLGRVWQHLADTGVEHCVIRPVWFMENLLVSPHIDTITAENRIYSGCGDGVAPWVSAEDIAQVTFHAIADKNKPDDNYRIVGPKSISMDEIAESLTQALGRKIEHIKLTDEENEKHLYASKMPAESVPLFLRIEQGTKQGVFDYKGPNDVERVTGRPPTDIVTWIEANKSSWM